MMQLPASKRRITDRKGRSVMKKFNYTIQDKAGIHARPAGVLVKKASSFASTITLEKDGVVVDLTKMIALMQLDVQCNEVVTITVDGTDEDVAAASMQALFEEIL